MGWWGREESGFDQRSVAGAGVGGGLMVCHCLAEDLRVEG